MKVFYDWEFVERGPQLPIQPVAGGFVAEDGRELYVINEECISNVLRHPWLSVNVVPSLPIGIDQQGPGNFITQWDPNHEEYQNVFSLDSLVRLVHAFLAATPDLELWAYYGAYDHVVLCQLFGDMAALPPEIPMFTHELQQFIEQVPGAPLPQEPGGHHALKDARWNWDVYGTLSGLWNPKPTTAPKHADISYGDTT